MDEKTTDVENPIDTLYNEERVIPPVHEQNEHDSGKTEGSTIEQKVDSHPKDTQGKTPEEYQLEIDRLKNELSLSEKRVKDTQRAMHEAKTEAAKLKKDDSGEIDQDDWFEEDDVNKNDSEDKEKKDEKVIRTNDETASKISEFEKQELRFMTEHSDYSEIVTEELINTISSQKDGFSKEWYESDKTPETLYKLGQRFKEAQEVFRDPDGYRKRILEEKNTKKTAGTPTVTDDGDQEDFEGFNRATSKGETAKSAKNVSDPVDELYG